jgi:septal ring factor EnvC (AmiA/AmiB activator)
MKKNISKHHEVSNAHSAEFQRIVNQKTKYLGQLNAAAKNWNKKVIEADSTEEYSTLLEIKIKELSTSFEEVVKVLAKSQSSSRAWKLKFEAAKTALASLKLQNKKQQHTYSGKTPLLFQPLRSRKEEKPWTFSLPPGRDSKTAYIPNLINRNSELLL